MNRHGSDRPPGRNLDLDAIEAALQDAEGFSECSRGEGATESRARSAWEPPSDSLPGFEIIREIHRGGQGVVYLAFQQATRRKVALKVLREGPLATHRERARFEREVQILAQIRHPNVVAIHDSGVAGGNFYYAMDYISGQPLDVHLAGGRRSVREVLQLFALICDAVNAAHLRGVIHRDLKPSNILIDAEGQPHIVDFGLAKTVALPIAPPGEDLAMTQTGQFIGSLPWASPEQAEGMAEAIDVRTDVYSLGVVLYHGLTGKFPYAVANNVREVLETIAKVPPTRPRLLNPKVDGEVETIVLKCLSKERDRRYQSAGEVARDIRRYLAGEPIEAKRDSAGYVIRKTLKRYRVPTSLAATFLVLGFGFGATGAVLYPHARAAQEKAEQEADDARAQLERSQRVTEFMQGMLLGSGGASAEPDWRDVYRIGGEMASLPPDAGFEMLEGNWRQVRSPAAREQLLRAFVHARHPRTFDVLHLGVIDPAPRVQNVAFGFLQDITLLDFTLDYGAYLAWRERSGGRAIDDVVCETYGALHDRLAAARPEERDAFVPALERLNTMVRNVPAVRELWIAPERSKLLGDWLLDPALGRETKRVLIQVIQAACPGEAFSRRVALSQLTNVAEPSLQHLGVVLLVSCRQQWAAGELLEIAAGSSVEDAASLRTAALALAAAAGLGETRAIEPALGVLARAVRLPQPGPDMETAIELLLRGLGDLGSPRAVPSLIGLLEANETAEFVERVGRTALEKLTGVRVDRAQDAAWWRRWWEANRARYGAAVAALAIPAFERTPAALRERFRREQREEADRRSGEDLLAELRSEIERGDASKVFTLAGQIARRKDPRFIPPLIGLIDADNSYASVYGLGYFALSPLTGVPYDERHDGAWWRAWWEKNRSRFLEEARGLVVPELPKTAAFKPSRDHGPDAGELRRETLDELVKRLEGHVRSKDKSGILQTARTIADLGDVSAIPALIGLIDADGTYDTVYGIGHFALGRLTGIEYEAKHDGAWWRAWWEDNRRHFPEAVRNQPIPDFR